MDRGTLATEILVRSGKDTTSGWVTDTMLNDWLSQSHRWAGGYKPWPFSEGRTSTTYTTANETWDFEGYKADSLGNDEGNQAIIEEALSYTFRRDGKAQESVERHLLAKQLLDELWKRVQDEQFAYQTHPDRGGQYRRFDVLKGSVSDEILKRDQF